MKRLILLLGVLGLATAAGVLIYRDPGYILLSYGHWAVELPLWLAIMLVGALTVILHLTLRLINFFNRLPNCYHHWRQQRRHQIAETNFIAGLTALFAGEWSKAENYLTASLKYTNHPEIIYLVCAQAAHEQQALMKRDDYLRLAKQGAPENQTAILIAQAQWQLASQQLEQAMATLQHLRELGVTHAYGLKLLAQAYQQLNDWENLATLLPQIQRQKVFSLQTVNALMLQTYQQLLQQYMHTAELMKLKQTWSTCPKTLRYHPTILWHYCKALKQLGQEKIAEKYLCQALKRNPTLDLAVLYSTFTSQNSQQQWQILEKSLSTLANHPQLLLALAKLAEKQALWGKAKEYLTKAITLDNSPTNLLALSRLHLKLKQPELALSVLR